MIDIHASHLIPLGEVPHYLPSRRGRRVHISTVYRWAQRGVGGRVLETVQIGGTLYTSIEALQDFASPRGGGPSPAAAPSSAALTREQQQAEREADEMGLR